MLKHFKLEINKGCTGQKFFTQVVKEGKLSRVSFHS
jgi:hypothetical protein